MGSEQVLWTCAGRKTLPPSTSLQVMGEIAGVNTASLGGYLHSTKTRARWAKGFHDELNGHVFDLGRDGLRNAMLLFILFPTEENLVFFLCCCFAKVLPSHFTEPKDVPSVPVHFVC